MSDSVDREEVKRVADLARVTLEEDEVAVFTDQFGDILDHFEALDDVPEVGVEPDLVNVMRLDEEQKSLPLAETLSNAEETENDRFKGPKVS